MSLSWKLIGLLYLLSGYFFFLVEPYERGFDCSDVSIRKPFLPLEIPLHYLLAVVVLLVASVIVCGEVLLNRQSETANKTLKTIINNQVKTYQLGVVLNFLICLIFKNAFGRLRPHAIDFCNAVDYCRDDQQIVQQFVCRNDQFRQMFLKNSRQSFYSGHASLGVYAGVYLTLYLNSKVRNKSLFLSLTLLLICLVSLYPGFSQWNNFWHHATDVLMGYAVGLSSAVLIFFIDCDNKCHLPLFKVIKSNNQNK